MKKFFSLPAHNSLRYLANSSASQKFCQAGPRPYVDLGKPNPRKWALGAEYTYIAAAVYSSNVLFYSGPAFLLLLVTFVLFAVGGHQLEQGVPGADAQQLRNRQQDLTGE